MSAININNINLKINETLPSGYVHARLTINDKDCGVLYLSREERLLFNSILLSAASIIENFEYTQFDS